MTKCKTLSWRVCVCLCVGQGGHMNQTWILINQTCSNQWALSYDKTCFYECLMHRYPSKKERLGLCIIKYLNFFSFCLFTCVQPKYTCSSMIGLCYSTTNRLQMCPNTYSKTLSTDSACICWYGFRMIMSHCQNRFYNCWFRAFGARSGHLFCRYAGYVRQGSGMDGGVITRMLPCVQTVFYCSDNITVQKQSTHRGNTDAVWQLQINKKQIQADTWNRLLYQSDQLQSKINCP